MNLFEIGNMHPILSFLFLYKMGNDQVNMVLEHPKIKSFLDSDEKFDVCVHEVFNADALIVSFFYQFEVF